MGGRLGTFAYAPVLDQPACESQPPLVQAHLVASAGRGGPIAHHTQTGAFATCEHARGMFLRSGGPCAIRPKQ